MWKHCTRRCCLPSLWHSPCNKHCTERYFSVVQDQKHAQIIDGKKWANHIKNNILHELRDIQSNIETMRDKKPGLAVIQVSDRPDASPYVRMKRKTAEELGFYSLEFDLPADKTTEQELLNYLKQLNENDKIHGILVQLPLPEHLNEETILNEIAPEKDVDGLHPINMGNLSMKGRYPLFYPCTPKGVLKLLELEGVDVAGTNAVVLGRSNIVGIPLGICLMHRNATVTMCHSKTTNVEQFVRNADLVVAACGIPNFVKREWIKPGAVVIDVGINVISDPSRKTGRRIVGDVDFEQVRQVAGKITPVPGGVGPMTIAMLMLNTLESFKRFYKLS